MRILFSFVAGRGHFEPLVPVARAAAREGHEVAFGCDPSMVAMVEGEGFGVFVLGRAAGRPPERLPLRPLDREREDRDLRERFARRAARHRAPLVLALCDHWRPDVLVCDETDFGAMLAAEKQGLPHASVLVIAAGSFVRAEVVGEALGELRAEHGLPPDSELEMLRRFLVLSPFPPSLRDPAHPLPVTAHAFRATAVERSTEPGWSSVLPGAPRIWFSLGTVFNLESGDLLERVTAGLRELPANLLVTVGAGIDPAELGPQPAHVRVERFVPQAALLPHCDLVVSHGGSGSVLGALTHGLPMLLVPLGADQPANAQRCAELGVARVLDAVALTSESVRAAAAALLADPDYCRRAENLRDEIAALPGPDHAVGLLERLVSNRRPLYSV